MTKKNDTLTTYIEERRKWLTNPNDERCNFIAGEMPTDLVNPQTVFDAYRKLNQTFIDKNADYGNSFEESLNEFGLVAGVVRIGDKYNRLRTLSRVDTGGRVSESLSDTLLDMANYCVMTAVWLQGIEEERKLVDENKKATKK